MQDIEKIKEVKNTRRIGTYTFGVILVVLGILMAVQMFVNANIFKVVLMLWPSVFILFGIEIIYFTYKKNTELKYDFVSFILTLFIIGAGSLLGFCNFFLNQVASNENFKYAAFYNLNEREENYYFNEKIDIYNNSKIETEYSVVTNVPAGTRSVNVKYEYDKKLVEETYNVFLNTHSVSKYVKKNNESLNIYAMPQHITKLIITVYTDNVDVITYNK